jgi:flagellar hook-basal body complex protein FliE
VPDLNQIGPIQGRFPTELPQRLGGLEELTRSRSLEPARSEDIPTFGETLSNFIQDVDTMQKTAHESTRRMLTGEIEDVHQVMIAVEEAQTSFQLMMEIRNKLIDAYREIIRMQV